MCIGTCKAQTFNFSCEPMESSEYYRIRAYSIMYGNGDHSNGTWYYSPDNHQLDIASDDALKGSDAGDQPDMTLVETHNWTTANTLIKGRWDALNNGIIAINNSMTVLDTTQGNSDRLMAEAKFVRAYFNFEKKRLYNDGDWYTIEKDYLESIEELPNDHSGNWPKGRPTILMAKSMLGKAYLYQEKWYSALQKFTDVINSGKYSLVSEFTYLWYTRYENSNTESIWSLDYRGDGYEDWDFIEILNTSRSRGLNHPYISPWGCCGFYQVSQDLVDFYQTENGLPKLDDSWKTNHITNPTGNKTFSTSNPLGKPINDPEIDPRLDFSVGRPDILFSDFSIYGIDYTRDYNYAGPYYSKKHMGSVADFGLNGWGNLTGVDYHIMRYADLLLMTAEAYIEVGNLESGRLLINQVRERAKNMTPVLKATQDATRLSYTIVEPNEPAANYNIEIYANFLNQEEARKALRFERRLELSLEGHRYFDLVRWGILETTINDYIDRESEYRTYLEGTSFSQNYWPKSTQ